MKIMRFILFVRLKKCGNLYHIFVKKMEDLYEFLPKSNIQKRLDEDIEKIELVLKTSMKDYSGFREFEFKETLLPQTVFKYLDTLGIDHHKRIHVPLPPTKTGSTFFAPYGIIVISFKDTFKGKRDHFLYKHWEAYKNVTDVNAFQLQFMKSKLKLSKILTSDSDIICLHHSIEPFGRPFYEFKEYLDQKGFTIKNLAPNTYEVKMRESTIEHLQYRIMQQLLCE
jgi:hypothetical protein